MEHHLFNYLQCLQCKSLASSGSATAGVVFFSTYLQDGTQEFDETELLHQGLCDLSALSKEVSTSVYDHTFFHYILHRSYVMIDRQGYNKIHPTHPALEIVPNRPVVKHWVDDQVLWFCREACLKTLESTKRRILSDGTPAFSHVRRLSR